ncbi:MAG: peptide deformylase [Waddliaceae bacterium]|jgi:peptide deformylase|nr:peptide deformylase [Waddliaceae bacterium]MBT3578604.1 peptide deformylase [Waddliaceae bacterium]MBT4445530.1 peptide deformylase [Waddliaceae bacterium]MBT6928409.1 peptide deformylase [Waddliaceae bacterium]MBT7265095.1 peptide deformylase [Waddliaceae bacterium]
MIRKIVYYPDPVLREKSEPIEDINDEIKELVADMVETMDESSGIGLAASQIGVSKRVFVIRLFTTTEDGECIPQDPQVFINPKLSNHSEETIPFPEGCLSVPGIHEDVIRSKTLTIEAQDLEGNTFTENLCGLKARVVMHEKDHLNGILFIDKITDTEVLEKIAPILHDLET